MGKVIHSDVLPEPIVRGYVLVTIHHPLSWSIGTERPPSVQCVDWESVSESADAVRKYAEDWEVTGVQFICAFETRLTPVESPDDDHEDECEESQPALSTQKPLLFTEESA